MLQNAEIITDHEFIAISTICLELLVGGAKIYTKQIVDGAYILLVSDHIRSGITNLPQWRNHKENELLCINDMKSSKLLIDKITKLSLHCPEF